MPERDRDRHTGSYRDSRDRKSSSRHDYENDRRYHRSNTGSKYDRDRDEYSSRDREGDLERDRDNYDRYRHNRDRSNRSDRTGSRYDDRPSRRHNNRSVSPDRSRIPRRDRGRDTRPPPRQNPNSKPSNTSGSSKDNEERKVKKWVADEDDFVLKQMKHGAIIRIKEGRSKPIDWLAANLRLIEGDPSVYDADADTSDLDFEIPVPYAIVEGLNMTNLTTLEQDIQKYSDLDKSPRNAEFWSMMQVLCENRKESLKKEGNKDGDLKTDDIVQPVSEDIDAVLSGKSFDELVDLEKQVKKMLSSDDPSIDQDFWQRLIKELTIRKAKAKLEQIHDLVTAERLKRLRKHQHAEALRSRMQISQLIEKGTRKAAKQVEYTSAMDIIPKNMTVDQIEMAEGIQMQKMDITVFMRNFENTHNEVKRLGFVPMKTARPKDHARYVVGEFNEGKKAAAEAAAAAAANNFAFFSRSTTEADPDDPDSIEGNIEKPSMLQMDGNDQEEEEFNGDDTIIPMVPNTKNNDNDSNLQKPRFYNRVILGYEWNRYNQIHYNSNNPPPKIVQGYKFNIFYPELIDSKKAPTFSIIRDKHKSHKQLATAAGQSDTCIINFHSGPPYQDLAFKIVDRQWDNSTYRGSRCKFEDGVLQVHFRFKRVYYRK